MALTLQGNQYLPAGHVLQPSISELEISFCVFLAESNFVNALIPFIGVRLDPVPLLAEKFGNSGSPFVPMVMDNGLNHYQFSICNGSVSDCYGYHDNCISERYCGRHPKMQEYENIFSG